MILETQVKDLKRAALKKPLTASELAERAGYDSGRAVSRAIGRAVDEGYLTRVEGRPVKYTRA